MVFATAFLKASLQDLFEARLEGLFNLALSDALDQDWVCEAFKQVHRVTVSLHVVAILTTQHVEFDSISAKVFNQ